MKKEFSLVCTKCSEYLTVYCTNEELEEILEKKRCPICRGKLRRKWTFGYGKLKGSGFTRKGGLI